MQQKEVLYLFQSIANKYIYIENILLLTDIFLHCTCILHFDFII